MGKKAVLIGCTYPGTSDELAGCVNDVKKMKLLLLEYYGFAVEDIKILIDSGESCFMSPTGENILQTLNDLVQKANPGDILFIHYSGHGMRLPISSDQDDETGYDECIVPTDHNIICDDDFREIVDQVPDGCRLTIVSDSCSSGGLIAYSKEQIGDSTKRHFKFKVSCSFILYCFGFKSLWSFTGDHHHVSEDCDENTTEVDFFHQSGSYFKIKHMPISSVIRNLKSKAKIDDIHEGNLRERLVDTFGEHASPNVKKYVNRRGHAVSGESSRTAETQIESNNKIEASRNSKPNLGRDNGILISGCQSIQSSADHDPSDNPDDAYGVLSNAIQTVIMRTGGKVTNFELVTRVRDMIKSQGYTQSPGLYCSDDNANSYFLC